MALSKQQWAYACLAIVGLVATWYFNIRFMLETSFVFDVAEFLRQGFANNASSSLSADVTVGALAFSIWVLHESKRLNISKGWIFVVLTWTIAFAFAFPLFLIVRENYLLRLSERGSVAT
ncbi:MAG: DUF2834 domain-containing protein [Proteobacteria bacterium]|nr:DUF2834 domain-containing protein [Pseudomonadota bacterium]